jgi:hypothetical protein
MHSEAVENGRDTSIWSDPGEIADQLLRPSAGSPTSLSTAVLRDLKRSMITAFPVNLSSSRPGSAVTIISSRTARKIRLRVAAEAGGSPAHSRELKAGPQGLHHGWHRLLQPDRVVHTRSYKIDEAA